MTVDANCLQETPQVSENAIVCSCTLGRYTEIAEQVNMQECMLGDYSYVMERSELIYAQIGKFVSIASDVRINPGNHPVDWVSQHHFLYRTKKFGFKEFDEESYFNWRRLQSVVVGHDVWIGHKSIIMPGVTIGNGAVVGAGSIVTGDVAPYTIVVGAPARKIRMRFPKTIWPQIERTCWWDWDHETIKSRIEDFHDIRKFIALYASQP